MIKLLALLFFFSTISLASTEVERLKIGLALSGGGAKGAAHLGVIRVLEQLKIPVDYVAGTSMGTLFAGLYAMGYSSEEIEQRVMSLDWNSGYVDAEPREHLSVRQKRHFDRYLITDVIGVGTDGVKFRSGMVQGQTMNQLLRRSTGWLESLSSFDDLPVPFRAVATDLETITPVVLAHGDLSKAMMASMAVPGALRPVKLNGRILVDGGWSITCLSIR